VSKPKSSPPRAATTELFARYAFIFMGSDARVSHGTGARGTFGETGHAPRAPGTDSQKYVV